MESSGCQGIGLPPIHSTQMTLRTALLLTQSFPLQTLMAMKSANSWNRHWNSAPMWLYAFMQTLQGFLVGLRTVWQSKHLTDFYYHLEPCHKLPGPPSSCIFCDCKTSPCGDCCRDRLSFQESLEPISHGFLSVYIVTLEERILQALYICIKLYFHNLESSLGCGLAPISYCLQLSICS